MIIIVKYILFGKKTLYINDISTNSRGVAILLKYNFEPSVTNVIKYIGNCLTMDLEIEKDYSQRKINIYAPDNDDPTFFNYIENLAINNPCDYLLVCGDFNLVLNPDMDCLNYKQIKNPRSRQVVLTMLDNLHFIML